MVERWAGSRPPLWCGQDGAEWYSDGIPKNRAQLRTCQIIQGLQIGPQAHPDLKIDEGFVIEATWFDDHKCDMRGMTFLYSIALSMPKSGMHEWRNLLTVCKADSKCLTC